MVHRIATSVLSLDGLTLFRRSARLLHRVHLGSARVLLGAAGIDFVLILELLLAGDQVSAGVRLQLLFGGKTVYVMATAANGTLEGTTEIRQTLCASNYAGKDGVLFCKIAGKPGSKAGGSTGGRRSELLIGIDACAGLDKSKCEGRKFGGPLSMQAASRHSHMYCNMRHSSRFERTGTPPEMSKRRVREFGGMLES